MTSFRRLAPFVAWIALVHGPDCALCAQSGSTRVTDPNQHARTGTESYPFRARSEYILGELDLRPGDVVVDVGAGDGWWTERMAELVGGAGVVHAPDVNEKRVDGMKKKFADVPRIKPYVCEKDGTGLAEDSCDLVFVSQTYHHFELNGHVRYLRHLHEVVKPTGRLCVIEKYPQISTRHHAHGTPISRLTREAEDAGWILVRYELMPRTYHYLAIFVQRELFPPEPEPDTDADADAERDEPRGGKGSGAGRRRSAGPLDLGWPVAAGRHGARGPETDRGGDPPGGQASRSPSR